MTPQERCPMCQRATGETIGLRCRLRLHAWTRWTDREEHGTGLFGEFHVLRRTRECLRCGLFETGESRGAQAPRGAKQPKE